LIVKGRVCVNAWVLLRELGDDSFLQLKEMMRQLKKETQSRRNFHVALLPLGTHRITLYYLILMYSISNSYKHSFLIQFLNKNTNINKILTIFNNCFIHNLHYVITFTS